MRDYKEFTFLTYEQIFGDNKLDIFKKYGIESAMTDFSKLLGGSELWKNTSKDGTERERVCFWWTSTKNSSFWHENEVYIVYNNICWNEKIYRSNIGARPAIPYSLISSHSSNEMIVIDGLQEVEYGEYPQDIVPEDFARTLERKYLNKTINQTGKTYTTDSVHYEDKNTPFQAITHIEYEYDGKKYIRFVGDSNYSGKILSDGRTVQEGIPYWVEVKPIKWLIDEKADIALSKKIIFSGIKFDRDRRYDGNFNRTNIKKFMDRYFSRDIIQSKTKQTLISKKQETNQKASSFQTEIYKILEEIRKYSINFQKQDQLKIKINSILEQYNRKLENLNNIHGISLESEESIKIELVTKLSQILEKLKSYYTNNEVFYNAINDLDQMIGLLNQKDKKTLPESEKDITLVKDMEQIVTVCLPYISKEDREEITKEILEIITDEKKKLKEYLTGFENLTDEISLEDIRRLEYSSLEGFELLLREKLQPILIKLKNKVDSKSIEIEMKQKLEEVIDDSFETSKNKIVVVYLNEINKLKDRILELILDIPEVSDVYRNKLNKIITKKIDYTKNTIDILKEINLMIISLYKLENEIRTKIDKNKSIKENRINIRL